MLSLLERERDEALFNQLMAKFNQYWAEKEPAFVHYFQQYYANRPGMCKDYIDTSKLQLTAGSTVYIDLFTFFIPNINREVGPLLQKFPPW